MSTGAMHKRSKPTLELLSGMVLLGMELRDRPDREIVEGLRLLMEYNPKAVSWLLYDLSRIYDDGKQELSGG